MHLEAQRNELAQLGFRIVAETPDRIVATAKRFHWECMFTRISYVVFVRRVEELTVQMIEADRAELQQTAKGIDPSTLPRGLQKGTAVITAYVADRVTPDAQRMLENKPKMRFAFFYIPAALDQSTRLSHFIRGTPAWGAIYYSKFRYVISRLLTPQASKPAWPVSAGGATLTILMIVLMIASFSIIFGARR
jgi:hypothetical protein